MLFNSIEFALFLPAVFLLYWFGANRHLTVRNLFLWAVSYVFYGWWDYRFLSLIFISTLVDYLAGIRIHAAPERSQKKKWLAVSIAVNIGLLGFFKYFNFFTARFAELFGLDPASVTLNIVLPVGISFYTFQTMSYSIDIYRDKLEPTRDFVAFAAFVSFFPQLVAGPIERASSLLPQFLTPKKFTYENGIIGIRQIVYGLFKKIVIADTLAKPVEAIFRYYCYDTGVTLLLGAVFFSVQIYCDFSGYSDIATGTARLFGFDLMTNFRFPYFSRSIHEFWRRWHISLTTWFRDYLYIPLGGSHCGNWKSARNVLIVFLVSGFWHGASWTFVIWGLLHACLFLPTFMEARIRPEVRLPVHRPFVERILHDAVCTGITFMTVSLAWIFFRAPTPETAIVYLSRILPITTLKSFYWAKMLQYVVPFFIVDYGVMRRLRLPVWAVWLLMLIAVDLICVHAISTESQQFIYFNF